MNLKHRFDLRTVPFIAAAILALALLGSTLGLTAFAQTVEPVIIENPWLVAQDNIDLDEQAHVFPFGAEFRSQDAELCNWWLAEEEGEGDDKGNCVPAGERNFFSVDPTDELGSGNAFRLHENCWWSTRVQVIETDEGLIDVVLHPADEIEGDSPVWCYDGEVVLLQRGASTFHNGTEPVELTADGEIFVDGVEHELDENDDAICLGILDRKSGDIHFFDYGGVDTEVLQLTGHGYGYERLNRGLPMGAWWKIVKEYCHDDEPTATHTATATGTATDEATATNTPSPTPTPNGTATATATATTQSSACPSGVVIPNDVEEAVFLNIGAEVKVFDHANAGGLWVLRRTATSLQLVRNSTEVMQEFAQSDASTGGIVMFVPKTGTVHVENKPEGNSYGWQLDVPNWNPHFKPVDRIGNVSPVWSCVEKVIIRRGETYMHNGVPVRIHEDGACSYGDTVWCSRDTATEQSSTCFGVFDPDAGTFAQVRKDSFTADGKQKSHAGEVASARHVGVDSPDGTERLNGDHDSPINWWKSKVVEICGETPATATPTPTLTATPTASPTPTLTPTPTMTPTPTATSCSPGSTHCPPTVTPSPTPCSLWVPLVCTAGPVPTATKIPPTSTPVPRLCINTDIRINGNSSPNIGTVRLRGDTHLNAEWTRTGGAIEPDSIEWTVSVQNHDETETKHYKLFRNGTRQPAGDWISVEDPTQLVLNFWNEFESHAAGSNVTVSVYPFYSVNTDLCPQGSVDFYVDP